MCPNVDLPGKRAAAAGAAGAVPTSTVSCPVPHVHAPRGRSDAQRAVVVRGADHATQRGQDPESVEARGEAGQVDVFGDGDAGQDPVPARGLSCVSIDVDDDQASWAAGYAYTEFWVSAPPLLNAALVEGGSVKTVTPAAVRQAGTARVSVPRQTAVFAVRRGGFAPRCEGWTGQPRRAHQRAVASDRPATERSGAGCRESLRENRSSADIYFPYQRPKRLNDGHRVANAAGEVAEHMRKSRQAVSMMRPTGRCQRPRNGASYSLAFGR